MQNPPMIAVQSPLSDDTESAPPSESPIPPTVAIRFHNYTDLVEIPYTSNINFTQLSFAVWIYSDHHSLVSDPCYILAKKGSFALGLRSDEVAMAFHNKRPGWQWIGSRWKVPIQTWTHIAVTYDSTRDQACIFANGAMVFEYKVKGKLKGSSQPLLVGVELKLDSGDRTRFKGYIAQISLWKTAIDKETINAHMHSKIQGDERGLLGHWPAHEGVGTEVKDATDNQRHGQMSDKTCWWMSLESTGQVPIPESTLMQDMKKMFNSQLASDVKLVASDGKEIHAHRIILATRSEAFQALLFGGMRESKEEEIKFPDLSYEVLSILVEFLYTDNAEINGDIVVNVFMAADRYQLKRLRALCENYILQNISLDNVCTIFQTADHLHAEKLRGFCFNWIINNFGHILTCDAITQLPADLQKEINLAASIMHFSKKRKTSSAIALE
eukprot:TRINITY_DN9025_c0_g1_i1.p1 TRINITY_DN9025_c0_g1~~TRINITY_DN9025_c0_g1_i1.p1  ORF type:complete len:441 (+),score=51.03 TRINITY_DN9025_c0_g1_i1:90-1412(+)